MRSMTRDAVELADRARLVELLVRLRDLLGQVRVERELERHLDDGLRDDHPATLLGEPARDLHRFVGRIANGDGYEDVPVLEAARP